MAEAMRYYAPHSFSVQTSKENFTLANHVYASGQLLSHSWPHLGQLVHVNFLTLVSYRVLGWRAIEEVEVITRLKRAGCSPAHHSRVLNYQLSSSQLSAQHMIGSCKSHFDPISGQAALPWRLMAQS